MWLIRNGRPGKDRVRLTTRAVPAGPPTENAALILSGAPPGLRCTFRSRGIDMTVEVRAFGFRRTRMIVSERAFFLSLRSFQRRSEPMTRNVCGLAPPTSPTPGVAIAGAPPGDPRGRA